MDTTDSGQDTTGPTTRRRGSARAGLLGAVVGAGALIGGLVLATGGAGAQPTTAGSAATPAPADEVVLVDDELAGDDEFWAELETAFGEYEACLVDNGLIDEADLAELEELDWEEAELLEGELEDGDWDEAYLESDAIVLVENEDGSTFVEFGDGDGSVSVAKVDGEIVVNTDGDVAVETITWDELEAEYADEAEWDEAFEVCDPILDDIEELEDDYFGDEYAEEYDLDDDHDLDDHDLDAEELDGEED